MERISSIVDRAVAKAERKKKRSAEAISECDEEMRVIQERKSRLSQERQQYQLIASLKKDGASAWNSLKEENKWTKENVLAVFCSGRIPHEMREANWSRNAPEPLRDDRDILIARLTLENFSSSYWHYSNSYYGCREGHDETPPFRIPGQFLGDKIVVEMVVRRYPEVLMQDILPRELLDDDDVFCAYLNSDRMKNLLFPRDDFENLLSKFSTRIRRNAKLMLKAAKCIRGTAVFDFVSERLAESATFAIQLVNTVEEAPDTALEHFSDRAQADPKVARAFVRKNGLCLKHVAKSLRGNNEIVRLACKNDAAALIHCAPGRTKRRLGQDKEFMMDIYSRIWGWQYSGLSSLYKMLSPELKRDPECVAAAHQARSLLISDLPNDIACDSDFWMDMVKRDSTFWYKLPVKFEGEAAFARNIAEFVDETLVADVLERFPCLSSDRDIWTAIIDSPFDDDEGALSRVIVKHAPEQIRLDKELMLRACRNEYEVLEVLTTRFQEDRGFVEAAIQSFSPYALYSISHAAQCLYPDLVVEAISNVDGDLDESAVAEDLWSNVDIIKAWLQATGDCPSYFPETVKENKDFALWVAEHCDMCVFKYVTSEALRRDKAFMMQAIGANCWNFLETVDPLHRDFDLAVVAFSDSRSFDLLEHMKSSWENDDDHDDDHLVFLWNVFEKSQEKLKAHDGFTKGLLCGMSDHAGSECRLPMLLNGEETSLAFKKCISEYLGVPTGKELHALRQVVKNLGDLPDRDFLSVPV